ESLLAGRRAAERSAVVHDQPDFGASGTDRREKRRHSRRREVAALRRRTPAAPLKERLDELVEATPRHDLADAGRGGDLSPRRDDSGPAFVRRIAIARED